MASIEDQRFGDYAGYRLTVDEAALAADVVPCLAMLCAGLRRGGADLLDEREGIAAYGARGATMGLPLLFPWANRLAGMHYRVGEVEVTLPSDSPLLHVDPNGLPLHGVQPRGLPFQVVDAAADATAAWVQGVLDSASAPEVQGFFPFDYRLTLRLTLTAGGLAVWAEIEATGTTPVPVCFGWHPYLTLPGTAREGWHIELPVGRHLILDDHMIPTGQTEPAVQLDGPLAERTFDDGYTEVDAARPFVVRAGERRLQVHFEAGCPFAQVYAPPGSPFICIEPMTAPANALTSGWDLTQVQPGERYRAAFRIDVEAPASRP